MKSKVLFAEAALLLALSLVPACAFAGGLPNPGDTMGDVIDAVEDSLLDNPLLKPDPIKILPDIPLTGPQTQAP